jgi:hypothetical protein
MSTMKKIGGKQFALGADNRKAALKFYADMSREPGIVGAIAAEVYRTLHAIHRDSALNSAEKENEFRNIIRRFAKPSSVDGSDTGNTAAAEAVADVDGLPPVESVSPTDE